MGKVIQVCPGRVWTFSQGKDGGSGMFKLRPEITVSGGKVILNGPSVGGSEIVQPEATLDRKKFLYLYGSAWTDVAIQGRVLLGESSDARKNMSKLQEYFERFRVSKAKRPIALSSGKKAQEIYLVGLQFGQINPQFHYMDFTLLGKLGEDD